MQFTPCELRYKIQGTADIDPPYLFFVFVMMLMHKDGYRLRNHNLG
jgi:hypothetical protein